jgi:hypothetical protein
MPKVTWARVAAWRVRQQFFDRLMSSAELSAWARVAGLDREAIQRALWDERTLVKTCAMRGTLHLLPSAELPLWHAALGTSRRYLREALWKKYFGLTLEDLDRLGRLRRRRLVAPRQSP